MCTFINDPSIELPTEKKITAYKVFGKPNSPPMTFSETTQFNFGKNDWDGEMAIRDANGQSGFQVFVMQKEAEDWKKDVGNGYELVCPVIIKTKDIIKATNDFRGNNMLFDKRKVYEVLSFRLLKKDWKEARSKR